MARRVAALALLALLATAPAARADGDPASDFLLSRRIFLPYDTKIPQVDQQRLGGTVNAAFRAGYPVRVAVIGSAYDLGAVTVLWRQPQRYAKFLAIELSFVHKGPLVVVMPNGLGFWWVGHDSAKEQALVRGIAVPQGASGLAQAGESAVKRLASARGLQLAVPQVVAAAPSHRNRSDRIVIAAAAAALLLAGAAARLLLRRRRTP